MRLHFVLSCMPLFCIIFINLKLCKIIFLEVGCGLSTYWQFSYFYFQHMMACDFFLFLFKYIFVYMLW